MYLTFSWNLLIYNLFSALSSLVLDGNQMITINFPIISISIIIYLLAFYMNYFKVNGDGTPNELERGIKRKTMIGLLVRVAISILFGMLHVSLAIGLSCYFSFHSIGYAKEIMKRTPSLQRWKVVADLLYLLVPVFLTVLLFVVGGEYAFIGLIPVSVAVLLHVHWGKHHVKIPVMAYFERYEWNLARRIPTSIQYALCITMVGFILIPLIGLVIANGSFLDNGYLLLSDIFDPVNMITVNVPFIFVSRLVFIKARAGHYHAPLTQENGKERTVNLDLNDRIYKIHKITNNFTIIAAGMLVIHVSLAVGTYSLLQSIYYMTQRGTRDRSTAGKKIGIVLICALIPVALVISTLVYPFAFILVTGLISISMAVLLVLLKGNAVARLAREDLVRLAKPRWRKITLALQVVVLVYGIGMPAIFISGNLGGGPAIEHYMLEMSDGVHLATDVYFSQVVGRQPAPVILVRTPYGKNETGLFYASMYTAQGYHVVSQDFRGTFESEGGDDFLVFTKDLDDAPETIAWIRSQSWCNGKVGSVGASALCITQYMYAGMNPDGLLAQSFWFGTPDLIEDAILEGAFHKGLVEYWLEGVAHDNWRKQMDIIFEHMTNLSLLDELAARSVTLNKPPNTYEKVNTRGIHVGGFYDHFLRGTIRGYMNFDDRGTERARGHQKLVIGPWTHVAVMGGKQGELTYPASSNGLGLLLDWETEIFNEAFLGIPANWNGNRVAYYLMGDLVDPSAGANYWKFALDWPINNSYQTWYLGIDATSNKKVVLDGAGLQSNVNLSYLYDPRDPIYTRGGNNEPSYTEKGAGPFDQRPVETTDDGFQVLRDDLLLFQSDVIQEPLTFEGDLKARLHVSSNCTDTDFMVKLCDIYPDGRRMLVIDSALTTRYRVNKSSENFLVPCQEYVIDVDLIATAYKFNTGHRIGITIQSSNYDRYIINPNTGGPITDHYAEGFIANNTIITGPGKSCIYFPVII